MSRLTAALGDFLARFESDSVPPEALPLVRDAFTDTVAVMMVGIPEPVTQITYRVAVERGGRQEARACLSEALVSSMDAALLGGTAAHSLDYDDQALSGHPSAVLCPLLLAEGERLGASGRDIVAAYVAGYEVWGELLRRDANYHTKGWHPTSVYGTVAAAAAAAVLNKLSAERASAALAIAASHASGLAANFGTMTKPYHAGLAARNGVVAARLAAEGMTASDTALENPQGFLHAYSPGHPDRESPCQVGRDGWYILRQRACIKKYPTCYFMQRSFDAVVKMLQTRPVQPEEIEQIEVTMGKGQTAVLVNERPRTGLEAKFSEQFAMAAAVILGRMSVREVVDEVVQRPDIQAFFSKVQVRSVEAYDTRDPAHSPTERVLVKLRNGDVLDSGEITTIRGHANDPMSAEELWRKFEECTALTHTSSEAKRLFDLLQRIDDLPSAKSLPTCSTILRS